MSKTTIVLTGEELVLLQGALGYSIEFASVLDDPEQAAEHGDWAMPGAELKAREFLARKLEKARVRTLRRR